MKKLVAIGNDWNHHTVIFCVVFRRRRMLRPLSSERSIQKQLVVPPQLVAAETAGSSEVVTCSVYSKPSLSDLSKKACGSILA